ncbi:MAG: SdpI family protein, partial [Clostridia bacterium]|nr:SdpI family protein [Clostridia bacterium]
MLKKNWLKILISSLVTLSPIAFGLAVWNKLPETMSTHWGISGEADGFSSRTFAVFGLPLILLALNFICIVTSFFDKKNRGTKVHNMIYYIIPVISLFTNAMVYSAAFEKTWDFAAIIPLVLGLLFAVMGNLMPKIRQNSTLGIKVKWTLQSEENWNATHRFGGKVMVIAGLMVMLTAFLPVVPMFFTTMAIILIAVFATMLYSYLYYKKEVKNGKTDFNHICPKFNKVGKIISLIVVP